MRPVFVFILKFAVFRAKFRKNEGEKEKKEKKEKREKRKKKGVQRSVKIARFGPCF